MDKDRFLTHSLRDPRVTGLLSAALEAVDPGRIVQAFLRDAALPAFNRLFLLGIGKASEPMVLAAAEALPDFTKGLIVTKHATALTVPRRLDVMEGTHPVPDARSVMAGRAALDLVSSLSEDDLLICLISGGGSSLVTWPRTGVGLRDIQLLTAALMSAGASIEEINTLRRRLDGIKGGGLARATKARVMSLLLSDVIGDRLEAIASGLTVPDTTTGADALTVLTKYGVAIPPNVYSLLSTKPTTGSLPRLRVTNHVIGNSDLAVEAAIIQAQRDGLRAERLRTDLQGEASAVGLRLASKLRGAADEEGRPFCLVAGGETTVTVNGNGKGGRNQEVALGAVNTLSGLRDVLLVSLATDGEDGPTDAAGAVATGATQQRARLAGMEAADFLARNDSYSYFQALSDLLKPGYTGTNVNDLMFLIGL